jgi:asparagine synthase (glutamine-hydrolysing)
MQIEIQWPILSHKLIEFVFTLPDDFLLRDGWTKYIQRKSMEHIIPKDVCWRPDKVGYEPPQSKWMESKAITERIMDQKKKFDISDDLMATGKYTNSMPWKLFMASYMQ